MIENQEVEDLLMKDSFDNLKESQKTYKGTVPCHDYFTPWKIEEALEILFRYGKDIKVIAGGTDILVHYYDRLYEIQNWLDLNNIPELREIIVNKEKVTIGAMVTHTQL